MSKKYYWIKLKTDFFDLETIDWLISQKNGCEYVVLYQKLCLITANKGGELVTSIGEMLIPYDANKIARDTKFSFDTVVVAMELFKKVGLIYEQENGILKIPYVDDVVGCEGESAQRVRKCRKEKALQCNKNVTDLALQCNIENRDKSIDIRDKSIEKEEKADKSASSPSEIVALYHEICISYPKITVVSESRKRAMEALSSKFSIEQIKKALENAEKSNFLKGHNDRNWKANFDWLIKESNFVKVLDGNYIDRQHKTDSNKLDIEKYKAFINNI